MQEPNFTLIHKILEIFLPNYSELHEREATVFRKGVERQGAFPSPKDVEKAADKILFTTYCDFLIKHFFAMAFVCQRVNCLKSVGAKLGYDEMAKLSDIITNSEEPTIDEVIEIAIKYGINQAQRPDESH